MADMINLYFLIISIWVLSAFLMLMHYYSPRIGFAVFLVTMSVITVMIQNQQGIYIEPLPGFFMFLSSTMLVPVVLYGILMLYVVTGTQSARLTIYSIMIISLLVLLLQMLLRIHLLLPAGGTIVPGGLPPFDIRNTLGSLAAFMVDMYVIAIFYQVTCNYTPRMPEFVRVGLALLAALWADAFVFRLITDFGKSDFINLLPGDLLGKTIAALILWLPAGLYLARIAPHMPTYHGKQKRPTLDLIFGNFEAVKLSLIRVEAALEKSEKDRREQATYFEQIATNIHEALWLLEIQPNHSPTITYFNPAYDHILGFNAETRQNPQLLLERVHEDDQAQVRVGLERRLLAVHDMEYRLMQPDGTCRVIRERTIPIRNEQGIVYRIAGISEDVTTRKDHEKQQLEFEVQQERVKVLQDFISETSHDLKSPLTAINLKLFRLIKSEDSDNRHQLGKEITQQTQRMSRIIDDLLMLARADNISKHAYTALSLNAIVTAVYDELSAAAQAKQHTVLVELDENLPMIAGNQDDLIRVIHNLLDNAILYTPPGGQISLKTVLNGQDIIFRIKDTGIGIPENKIPHVFDRFFRAENAQALQANGTGLGLAIVKKFIEQHGGAIECVSAEGTGTMFTVRLPINAKPTS